MILNQDLFDNTEWDIHLLIYAFSQTFLSINYRPDNELTWEYNEKVE